MLLLLVGLTWCVTTSVALIPPWSPYCPQESNIRFACTYGNLNVTVDTKTLHPKACNTTVRIAEFVHPPSIHINSTNTTERYTVMIVDLGPQGKGPSFLSWMVTNVTVHTLRYFNTIPMKSIIAGYNIRKPTRNPYAPNVKPQTLVQILVFRHHNVLRVPFGELWVTQIPNFSLSTLFSNTNPTFRLCGPVAGAQYWLVEDHAPSAPPPPVPVAPGVIPAPPSVVPAPTSGHPAHHHGGSMSFPKRSSASIVTPMTTLLPLVILAAVWLWF